MVGQHLINPFLTSPISSGHALIDQKRHHGQMTSYVDLAEPCQQISRAFTQIDFGGRHLHLYLCTCVVHLLCQVYLNQITPWRAVWLLGFWTKLVTSKTAKQKYIGDDHLHSHKLISLHKQNHSEHKALMDVKDLTIQDFLVQSQCYLRLRSPALWSELFGKSRLSTYRKVSKISLGTTYIAI